MWLPSPSVFPRCAIQIGDSFMYYSVMDALVDGDLDDEDTDAAIQMSSEQDTTSELVLSS